MKLVRITCLVMALIAAVAYILMGVGILQPGNLAEQGETMPVFFYIIPVFYIVMGFAVFVKKRWVLIVDTAIVAFTIVVFYIMYATQPDVMWSAPGLMTKIPQVVMLAGLIVLLVNFKPGTAQSK